MAKKLQKRLSEAIQAGDAAAVKAAIAAGADVNEPYEDSMGTKHSLQLAVGNPNERTAIMLTTGVSTRCRESRPAEADEVAGHSGKLGSRREKSLPKRQERLDFSSREYANYLFGFRGRRRRMQPWDQLPLSSHRYKRPSRGRIKKTASTRATLGIINWP